MCFFLLPVRVCSVPEILAAETALRENLYKAGSLRKKYLQSRKPSLSQTTCHQNKELAS